MISNGIRADIVVIIRFFAGFPKRLLRLREMEMLKRNLGLNPALSEGALFLFYFYSYFYMRGELKAAIR